MTAAFSWDERAGKHNEDLNGVEKSQRLIFFVLKCASDLTPSAMLKIISIDLPL